LQLDQGLRCLGFSDIVGDLDASPTGLHDDIVAFNSRIQVQSS